MIILVLFVVAGAAGLAVSAVRQMLRSLPRCNEDMIYF